MPQIIAIATNSKGLFLHMHFVSRRSSDANEDLSVFLVVAHISRLLSGTESNGTLLFVLILDCLHKWCIIVNVKTARKRSQRSHRFFFCLFVSNNLKKVIVSLKKFSQWHSEQV